MKQALPSPEILHDLATENWQLRWQVLEIFNRVRFGIRDHARGSRQQQEHFHLGQRLATLLHSPQDQNLHLIVTAAYFLGGPEFLFLIFRHLGIDDRDEFYPGIAKIKKELATPNGQSCFLRYFENLLKSHQAVESTTAIAAELTVRLFSPDRALPLLIAIPYPDTRQLAQRLLARTHPDFSANDYLFEATEKLEQHPDLIDFIAPPLTEEQSRLCSTLATRLLDSGEEEGIFIAIKAITRLQLRINPELIDQLDKNNFPAAAVKAFLGDPRACPELESAARSWRQRKRCRALAGLAHCTGSKALEILSASARKHDERERSTAWQALAENPSPEALQILTSLLVETREVKDRLRLLALLARHPQAGTDSRVADLLAGWHDNPKLYPLLLECLAVFGYGPKWKKIIAGLNLPLTAPHHQEIALFMARYADSPVIRQALTRLLFDLDWCFTYRLLSLLQPHLQGREMKLLVRLLKEFEESSELSISERLTRISDVPRFDDALALFLNQNPAVAEQLLELFVNQLMAGELPTTDEIRLHFKRHDPELRKLILATDHPDEIRLENRMPLLYFQELLQQITLPGCHALAMVVHRTRRYNGYFRALISSLLKKLIMEDSTLQRTEALPALGELLDLIRRRPGYDHLREIILERSAAIRRRSRELKVHRKVTRDRDLRIIQVRNSPPLAPYSTK